MNLHLGISYVHCHDFPKLSLAALSRQCDFNLILTDSTRHARQMLPQFNQLIFRLLIWNWAFFWEVISLWPLAISCIHMTGFSRFSWTIGCNGNLLGQNTVVGVLAVSCRSGQSQVTSWVCTRVSQFKIVAVWVCNFVSDLSAGQSIGSIGVGNMCQCEKAAVTLRSIWVVRFAASRLQICYCLYCCGQYCYISHNCYQTGWKFEAALMPSQSLIVYWPNYKVNAYNLKLSLRVWVTRRWFYFCYSFTDIKGIGKLNDFPSDYDPSLPTALAIFE